MFCKGTHLIVFLKMQRRGANMGHIVLRDVTLMIWKMYHLNDF